MKATRQKRKKGTDYTAIDAAALDHSATCSHEWEHRSAVSRRFARPTGSVQVATASLATAIGWCGLEGFTREQIILRHMGARPRSLDQGASRDLLERNAGPSCAWLFPGARGRTPGGAVDAAQTPYEWLGRRPGPPRAQLSFDRSGVGRKTGLLRHLHGTHSEARSRILGRAVRSGTRSLIRGWLRSLNVEAGGPQLGMSAVGR